MAIELVVPKVGESITEVEIGDWLKKEGDSVAQDESVVVIDTAKATVELPAPSAGVITKVLKQSGEVAMVGEVIGHMETAGAGASAAPSSNAQPSPEWEKTSQTSASDAGITSELSSANAPTGGLENDLTHNQVTSGIQPAGDDAPGDPSVKATGFVMPAAQAAAAQNGVNAEALAGSGPGGRVLKEDVQRAASAPQATTQTPAPKAVQPAPTQALAPTPGTTPLANASGDEDIVPMSLLRRTIATRLVEAQQNAALLTTFNEIDMGAVMKMRSEHQDLFTKRYGVKLGFMSFFVKAAIDALKQTPALNAEIRGKNIVYKNHYDIGVAIGGGKGLVVPVIRGAERLSFAEIEVAIGEYAGRAKNNTLPPEALEGGTFTITNGGIYGSMMSTPIINPPQSGILGMHAIQERVMAVNGQVEIRPMMYVALTYDHRIVDGREAVTFLKRIKDCIENPARMLIEV
ncbi:MAG TPA: 2-oxoglutarate dehydrogenase complex dihydrolipoyllysine-residue succinyltransferase [Abditibacteriaceae bacterium]|jgi:2-oxoglutarate dehydrogenase E2 component (dihydrolipoamide succinyltransferase)